VRLTRLDVWINSLAIGVAFGVTAYLADGLVDAIMVGLLIFFVSFAVFDLLARNGRDGPDHECG
jgi:hypothetical protein